MTIPAGAGDVEITEQELETAVMVYLREVHGVPIGRVERVKLPVPRDLCDEGCVVTLKAK